MSGGSPSTRLSLYTVMPGVCHGALMPTTPGMISLPKSNRALVPLICAQGDTVSGALSVLTHRQNAENSKLGKLLHCFQGQRLLPHVILPSSVHARGFVKQQLINKQPVNGSH